jgi:hypothetical protein
LALKAILLNKSKKTGADPVIFGQIADANVDITRAKIKSITGQINIDMAMDSRATNL